MAVNRTALRTDIPYLSRRPKPVVQPEPTRPPSASTAPSLNPGASPAGSGGLTLGAGRAGSGSGRPTLGASPAASPSTGSGGLTLGASRAAAPSTGSGGLTLGASPAASPSTGSGGLTLGASPAAAPSTGSGGLTLGASPAASGGLTLGASPAASPSTGSGGLTLGASPAAAPSTGSGGLTLGASPAASPSTKTPAAARPGPRPAPGASERLFPAPDFGSVRELGEANPVVRLNARQSAIGSLLVAGVRSVAWEDQKLTTGAHHSEGHAAGTAVLTPGNRPLAGVQDGAGVVSLRHVRLLRRLLFVAGETPLTVGVFDGAAATVAARNDAGLRSVLYVVRVGAVLELRAEFVPADASDAAIWAIFGFTMTIPLDRRVLQR